MPRVRSELRTRRPAPPRRALPVKARRHPAGSPVAAPRGPAGARLAFTTRAALLGLAVCAVVLTLAYPARQYLSQRAKIANAARQVQDDKRDVVSLGAVIAQGNDPVAIRKQARERLQLKMPGDQVFYLPAPPAPSTVARHSGAVQTPVVPGRDKLPWYDEVWKSTVASSH